MDKRLSLEMFIVCNLYLSTAHPVLKQDEAATPTKMIETKWKNMVYNERNEVEKRFVFDYNRMV